MTQIAWSSELSLRMEAVLSSVQKEGQSQVVDFATIEPHLEAIGLHYDKKSEGHYDTISAFIKSIRASHPDAAVYYLATMLEGGEDPMVIARRLVIAASEDVGNANPKALMIATSAMQAVHQIGMPEARIILSQATRTCLKNTFST